MGPLLTTSMSHLSLEFECYVIRVTCYVTSSSEVREISPVTFYVLRITCPVVSKMLGAQMGLQRVKLIYAHILLRRVPSILEAKEVIYEKTSQRTKKNRI